MNVVRPDKPYDVAARALSALRDNEPYRNPRLVQDPFEDSSVAGSVFGKRRGGAREAEDSSRTKVKTALVLFAGKILMSHQDAPEALPIFGRARRCLGQ